MTMDLETAINDLYTYHVPASVRDVADLKGVLHDLAEYEPADSDAALAAQVVLQTPGGVEQLAEMVLAAGRALDQTTHVEAQVQTRPGGAWQVLVTAEVPAGDDETLHEAIRQSEAFVNGRHVDTHLAYRVQVVQRTTYHQVTRGDRGDDH